MRKPPRLVLRNAMKSCLASQRKTVGGLVFAKSILAAAKSRLAECNGVSPCEAGKKTTGAKISAFTSA
jgi:hypothetical protein